MYCEPYAWTAVRLRTPSTAESETRVGGVFKKWIPLGILGIYMYIHIYIYVGFKGIMQKGGWNNYEEPPSCSCSSLLALGFLQ